MIRTTIAAFAFVLVVATAYAALTGRINMQSTTGASTTRGVTPETLDRLVRGTKNQKLEAARLLGTASGFTAESVHAISGTLLDENDPLVRAEVLKTLQILASRNHKGEARHEPQLLDVMRCAYKLEKNAQTKRLIVEALADFNDPQAAEFLEIAAHDNDPSIRVAAAETKLKRDRRLLLARTG